MVKGFSGCKRRALPGEIEEGKGRRTRSVASPSHSINTRGATPSSFHFIPLRSPCYVALAHFFFHLRTHKHTPQNCLLTKVLLHLRKMSIKKNFRRTKIMTKLLKRIIFSKEYDNEIKFDIIMKQTFSRR